ncbi:hypothetical protein D917_06065 [Trichinella nativa]|uniref:Uncharacterized protein n=1 Tax=Trichinella nativa TaxID=6335 RepID=A0A1Y3EUE4_9BILA|nr:hypothetical protein D917_06082 [Trichinella nativa]OUC48579.1 hypothetical protein D917_06065 [Trichinella nativa]
MHPLYVPFQLNAVDDLLTVDADSLARLQLLGRTWSSLLFVHSSAMTFHLYPLTEQLSTDHTFPTQATMLRLVMDFQHESSSECHVAVAADESPPTAVPLDVVVELLSGGKISPTTDFASIIGLVGRNAGTAVHHLAMAVTFVCGAEQFQADQTFEPFFGR